MSDLSTPGLSLMPMGGEVPRPTPEPPPRRPYAWPTPPYAAYPAPSIQTQPEDCEIEGPNGKVTQGKMTFFDPEEGVVHVQVPPARGNLPLRLSQFRRLTLLRPISPTIAAFFFAGSGHRRA